jgi:hypothetical protein
VGAFRELLDRHSDRIGDVIELFAGANAELRAAIDSQPELALGLLQECPELFQPSDAHEAGASESEETPS